MRRVLVFLALTVMPLQQALAATIHAPSSASSFLLPDAFMLVYVTDLTDSTIVAQVPGDASEFFRRTC